MNTGTKFAVAGLLGVGLGLAGVAGYQAYQRSGEDELDDGFDDPLEPDFSVPPTEDDVEGDLETNWGATPRDLRPLFMYMEEASEIVGSGRIFSVIAYGESRWEPQAHNDSDHEVDASSRAYESRRDKNPRLDHGPAASQFGSGGLFGALAPYFLWTGAPEIGKRAPLLNYHPSVMFNPRFAGFAAIVYLKRLIRNWNLVDHLDIKVGWASPSILARVGPNRAGYCEEGHEDSYCEIRAKFAHHAAEVGIDLFDQSTIPTNLDASDFPGVLEVWRRMVGPNPEVLA